jgi:hypothetical protein
MRLKGYEKSDTVEEWSFREADVDEAEERIRCESRWGPGNIGVWFMMRW